LRVCAYVPAALFLYGPFQTPNENQRLDRLLLGSVIFEGNIRARFMVGAEPMVQQETRSICNPLVPASLPSLHRLAQGRHTRARPQTPGNVSSSVCVAAVTVLPVSAFQFLVILSESEESLFSLCPTSCHSERGEESSALLCPALRRCHSERKRRIPLSSSPTLPLLFPSCHSELSEESLLPSRLPFALTP